MDQKYCGEVRTSVYINNPDRVKILSGRSAQFQKIKIKKVKKFLKKVLTNLDSCAIILLVPATERLKYRRYRA